ncbi:hypothetical protein QOZ80_2AG0114350 [Eleusine coracana subsp. coracana]|nr:hypothetical protein QOZ80_2AG0114350 [Eleusine coracana subsp. coracana]
MTMKKDGGVDRLNDLPDDILGHILSFLPTEEAGRAAVLSTRWRYMFANVHTLSFQDTKDYNFWGDTYTFYSDSEERRSVNGCFLDSVNAALTCRLRCAGLARETSLRALSVGINNYYHWDNNMVQKWVSYALQQCGQEFHLDLRLHSYDLCQRGGAAHDDEDREYRRGDRYQSTMGRSLRFPRSLFSCAALRSLRVADCCLNPPQVVSWPSLETLHLTTVHDSEETIHRMIASCPRLEDLMLDSCSKVRRISVLDKRFRRFSLRCCHAAVSVSLDASELRELDYRGGVPAESLFMFHGSLKIRSCTIDFCGPSLSTEDELVRFRKFLGNLVAPKHLHLQSWRLGCSIESEFFTSFPAFSSLQKLELTGHVDRHTTVSAVPRILQQTPNLEVLTLFLKPVYKESSDAPLEYNLATIPDTPAILCLRQRLREVNLVHYQGSDEQRMLANLLLGNALVLQALCVVFPKASLGLQTRLMNEIKQMAVRKSAEMIFL